MHREGLRRMCTEELYNLWRREWFADYSADENEEERLPANTPSRNRLGYEYDEQYEETYRGEFEVALDDLDDLQLKDSYKRLSKTKDLLVEIPLDSLPEDIRQCVICQEDLCKVSGGDCHTPSKIRCGFSFGTVVEEEPHTPAKLKCGHVFGHYCVRRWVCEKGNCPLRCKIDGPSS